MQEILTDFFFTTAGFAGSTALAEDWELRGPQIQIQVVFANSNAGGAICITAQPTKHQLVHHILVGYTTLCWWM